MKRNHYLKRLKKGLTLWSSATLIGAVLGLISSFPLVAGAIAPNPTVTFNENDSLSDTVTAAPQFATNGTTEDLTLFANLTPAFTNPGHTFTGWNTQPDGSGTAFSNGEAYTFTANLVLYAQWTDVPTTNTVTFFENDSVTDAVNALQIGSSAQNLTLLADLTPEFLNSGFTFEGWNTEANGSGTSFSNGAQYSFTSNLNLYAQWQSDPPTSSPNTAVVISLDNNGGDGSVPALSGSVGSSVTLPTSTTVEEPGYTLTSWNTAANGSGASFAPGQTVTLSTAMTLYAQWTATSAVTTSTNSSTVHLVANGGSGSLATLTGAQGSKVTLPSSSSVVREGYTLTSWNTEANGKGTSYSPGTSVTLSSSITLYAQWTATGARPSVLYGAIGDFAKNSTSLSASLEQQVRVLAHALKSKKYTVVRLYGYTAATGLATLDRSLSESRASSVANYLRGQLRDMKVTGVTIAAAGEGSVGGKTSSLYSRVEVFVS